jgi:glycosyltransferase involved in cell wall biosynthesis
VDSTGVKETVMPLVSVVMSVYNDEERVGRSIDSILQQTFQDFEFIIINDGSTDGTVQVLDRYADQDSRIRVIHQENTGLTQALIRGCQQVQGQFIARQDSGDLSMPERLQAQSDFLTNHPDVSLVACSTSFVDPEGNIIFLREQSGYELEQGLVLDIDKIQNPPHHGSTMFLNSAYHQVGGYRSIFSVAQDMDLWLRLVEVGRCFCLDSNPLPSES